MRFRSLSCFFLTLCYFKLSKEAGGKVIFFVLLSNSSENLISVKLGNCNHVHRPVSRDRRILVMEVEMGKAVYLAYNIFTTNALFYK